MKSTAILWLVLCGTALFFLGFFFHKWIGKESDQAPPLYLERLAETGRYSENQLEGVRGLLEEEDRMIQQVLEGEKSREILDRIREIRKTFGEKVEKILNESEEASQGR